MKSPLQLLSMVFIALSFVACGKSGRDETVTTEAMHKQSVSASAVLVATSSTNTTPSLNDTYSTQQCTAWQQRSIDTVASFNGLGAITTDGGNLYVVDEGGHHIRKIEISTEQVSTLAGSGKEGADDGIGTAASFGKIIGLATDGKFLYAGDVVNQKIRKVDLASGQVTTLPISVKPTAEDGVGTTGVNFSGAIAVVGNNLYAVYGTNIRKINLDTGQVSVFAGHTDRSYPAKDGIGTAATFFGGISHIATDGENLYAIGIGISDIRKVSIATGLVSSIVRDGLHYPSILAVVGANLYTTDNNSIMQVEIASGRMIALAGQNKQTPQGLADSIDSIKLSGMVAVGDKLYVTYGSKLGRVDLASRTIIPLAGLDMTGVEDGAGAAFYPLGSIIAASENSLYFWGYSNNTLFKRDSVSGAVSVVAGSGGAGALDGIGSTASFRHPKGMVVDSGNLYVSDYGNHLIRKVVIDTGEVTTLAGSGKQGNEDGIGAVASFNYPRGIVSDGSNLYVADYDNHAIRKIEIATGKVSTFVGSGKEGAKDDIGTKASFKNPRSLAIEGTHLYVADTYNHTVRKIDIASRQVTTLAGSGNNGSEDGVGVAASFSYPQGLAISDGNLYVANYKNNTIRKIVLATGAVSTLAGSGKTGARDGTGTNISFNQPEGIATDGKNLYIADSGYHTIRKIELANDAVTTLVAARCEAVNQSQGDNGVASDVRIVNTSRPTVVTSGTTASFNKPTGITTDGSNLYVSDTGNNRIRKIEIATGNLATLAGTYQGTVDGIGIAAGFRYPGRITTIGENLYVADLNNHKIRKIEIATGKVTTLVENLSLLSGITTDGSNLYVAEFFNNAIHKIVVANGQVSTLVGSGVKGNEDGIGTSASFNVPSGMTIVGSNMYVADTLNNKIRKVAIASGEVATFAGSGKNGSDDGTGKAASFDNPLDIANDGMNLYVTDGKNNKIRKIMITTGQVTTLAGSGAKGNEDGIGTSASFNVPSGITTDGSHLYVADNLNNNIRKIVIATGAVSTLGVQETSTAISVATDSTNDGATHADRSLQPDYLLKECIEVSRGGWDSVDPTGMLAVELGNRSNRDLLDDSAVLASMKISLLEEVVHGNLIPKNSDTRGGYYMYKAEDYLGKDKAVFMAKFEGKHYKVEINFIITEAIDENSPQCPSAQLIKINGKLDRP